MNMDLKKQIEEAEILLAKYKTEADKADAAYRDWQLQDARRTGGSERQDRLHEAIGDDYKKDAYRARQLVKEQQALLEKLKKNQPSQ